MLGLFVFGVFLFSHPVFAATPLQDLGTSSGLPQASIGILIARIIRVILGTLGFLTVIMVFYGGFLYFMSGGDPDKIKKAKKVLTSTIIGLVIIFTSYSLASWILNKLLAATLGTGSITSTIKKYGEPFAGSLGAGIVESHYPTRNATEIPRNTKVFVTFKEEIDPGSIIKNYVADASPQYLDDTAVKIFKTAEGQNKSLTSAKVEVGTTLDKKTFVFNFKTTVDPVGYLGDPNVPVAYSVFLTPKIQKANNKGPAFEGINSAGYQWSFTLSTVIDLIPPKIQSVISTPGSTVAKNMGVELTFNEPMDPIASTGINSAANGFDHIKIKAVPPIDANKPNEGLFGTFEISNGYKAVNFITTDECAKDPCGNKIYCLPGLSALTITAKAATLSDDVANQPQAKLIGGVSFDGLVDAAGNSLDGSGAVDGKGDGKACGSSTDSVVCVGSPTPANDDYVWTFNTSDIIDTTVPKIVSLNPGVNGGSIDLQAPLEITFEHQLLASSINSLNILLTADPAPVYTTWFSSGKIDIPAALPTQSVVQISHATFLPASQSLNQFYWPVLTQGVRGANQFCMYPVVGPGQTAGSTCTGTATQPFCCNGNLQSQASDCKNDSNISVHP